MARFATGLVLALILLLNSSPLRAEAGKIYTPSYRYSGPQGSSIADEDVVGKDPLLATVFSILPGVVVHGFGNYYAENYDFGTRMFITELVGIGLWAAGTNIVQQPENWEPFFGGSHEHSIQQAGHWVTAGGITLFVLSFLGDLATAHKAAESYNKDHQLHFQLETHLGAPTLALVARF